MIINFTKSRIVFNFYLQTIGNPIGHSQVKASLIISKMQPSITAFFKTKVIIKKKETNDHEDSFSDDNPDGDEPQAMSESEPEVLPKTRGKPKRRPASNTDDDESEPEVVSKSRSRKKKRLAVKDDNITDDESEPEVLSESRGGTQRGLLSSDEDNADDNGPKAMSDSEPGGETKKRLLISDDSDDEGPIMTGRSNKRLALSSAETTPVKNRAEEEAPEPKEEQAPKQEKKDEEKVVPVVSTDSTGGDTENKTPLKAHPMFQPKPVVQSPLFNTELLVKKKIASGAYALHENIGVSWFKALQNEFDKPYFKKLSTFVKEQRQSKTVYPPEDQVYTWTHHHTIRDTRVVVIGQDPYHGPNQAHGLSFSVQKGIAIPKSLQNMYKELQSDITNYKHPGHGNLTGWSKQGVLMLNACLTVNKGEANSHQGKGWETFTDAVISWISKNVNHSVVFLLWGRFAQKKSSLIDKRHKILTAAHPSPLSADNGFFGCKHFSKTNDYLRSQKMTEIDWAAL